MAVFKTGIEENKFCTGVLAMGKYHSQSAKVQIGGQEWDVIPVGRGVRQGCPILPLLFDIVIDMRNLSVPD